MYSIYFFTALKKWITGFSIVMFFFFFLQQKSSIAQNPFEQNTLQSSQVDKIDFEDTTKAWQPFKPFETTYFIGNKKNVSYSVDTGLQMIQIYDPAQKTDFAFRNGGNVGQASQAIYFQNQTPFGFDLGYHAFDLYRLNKSKRRQYKTTFPFTEFNFNIGKNREQIANVFHSQNIRNKFQFDFEYNRTAGRGLFRNQQSTHNNFALQTISTSKNQRYTFSPLFILSIIDAQENGGLAQNGILFNKNNNLDNELLPVNLQRASTKFNDKDIRIRQSYLLGKVEEKKINDTTILKQLISSATLYNEIGYQRNQMQFRDFAPDTNFYGFFYQPVEDTLNTPDTLLNLVRFNSFYQKTGAQIQFVKAKDDSTITYRNIWIDAQLEFQFFDTRYTQHTQNFQNLNTHLYLSNHPKSKSQWSYEASAILSLISYNSGDILLQGSLGYDMKKMGKIKFQLLQHRYEPALFYQKFSTNGFSWQNQFKKSNLFSSGLKYTLEKYNFFVETNIFVYKNFTYSNEQKLPEQHKGSVSVVQVAMSKNFRWRYMGLDHQIRWQQVSKEKIIPLPELWIRNSLFVEKKLFKGALQSRMGIDMIYNADYFAQGYFPLTGQFYTQSVLKQKFYPVFDVWASFKIKTFRIFFKVEHVNQGLFSPPNFYNFLDLPGVQRAFRMGFSWRFYD